MGDKGAITSENASKLSKNALKRLRRDEHWEKIKPMKRRAYRERRKVRKQALQEKEKASEEGNRETTGEVMSEEQRALLRSQRKSLREAKLIEFLDKANSNFEIIIDCQWDHLHTEKATKSLAQQILQCYGSNKRSSNPVKMVLTGVSDDLLSKLKKTNVESWNATYVESGDYIGVSKKQLVYLSSDADEVLDELDSNCAYIIGGIVDRNRHKGATHKKAVSQNVRTMKLPIKEYISLSHTHVLTVNHVFDLLLERCKLKSWPAALDKVIPRRKKAFTDHSEDDACECKQVKEGEETEENE